MSELAGNPALIQFIKYAVVGGLSTAIHIVFFHAFAWKIFPALQESDAAVKLLGLSVSDLDDRARSRNSMLSNFGAFLFSNFFCYLMNVWFVFEGGKHNFWVEIGLFYLVSGLSMSIGTGTMGWLIRSLGMRTTYAFGANLVASLLINYAARKFFIFKG